MSRWTIVGAPIGVLLAVGAWWCVDRVTTAPDPDLGPAIVVTPATGDPTPPKTPGPGRPASPPSTLPPDTVVVPPAPVPDAGGDDDIDDSDDDADTDSDGEDDPDE